MFDKIIEFFEETSLLMGLLDTLYMVGISTIISYLIGFPLGVFMVLTSENGLLRNKKVNWILNTLINVGRSIPFIILIIILIPFSLFLIGKSYGPTSAIISLSIAASFFVGRIVEQSLKEVDKGIIESSVCMGASIWTIIIKVYLLESLPSLVRGIAITIVNIIGYSAMAGAVGAGGLGDIAIRFGYNRFRPDIMIITLIVIIIIVQLIQFAFDRLSKRIDKKIV